jgi:hypothetical protein
LLHADERRFWKTTSSTAAPTSRSSSSNP